MNLMIFFLRIIIKRIIALIKISPIVTIGAVIIIIAFIIAGNAATININTQQFIILSVLLFCISIIASIRKYSTYTFLLLYAKSSISNKKLTAIYYLFQAIFNNTLFLLSIILILLGKLKTNFSFYIPILTSISILFSFCVIYIRNIFFQNRISVHKHSFSINPKIKALVYDYYSTNVIQTLLISVTLFMLVFYGLLRNPHLPYEINELPLFFSFYLLGPLSIGSVGIIESISNTNWKFYAIVSPKNFKYFFRRTALFSLCTFGVFIILYIGIALWFFGIAGLKYVCALALIFSFAINLAYTINNGIKKSFSLLLFISVSFYILNLNAYLLALLVIPSLYTRWNAKTDYKDWLSYDTLR